MVKRVLTDAQQWAILIAPASVSTAELARCFGVSYHTVYAFRAKDRPHGWSCQLQTGICAACGGVLLVPPQSHTQKRHRQCRIEANRQRQAHLRQSNPAFRAVVYDRARERQDALTAATTGLDINRRTRWTDAEKQYLHDHRCEVYTMEGVARLAKHLGRSYAACQGMLRRLDAQERNT